MLRSGLCDYSDVFILVKGALTITRELINDAAKRTDERAKEIICRNCAPLTYCISEINKLNAKCYYKRF